MKHHANVVASLRQVALAVTVLACAIPPTQAVAAPFDWIGGGEQVKGSGTIKKQSRELGHFTGISLSVPGNLELKIGSGENITIETDDNILPMIETVVENGILKIRPTKRNANFSTRTMRLTVNAKDINRLSLGGSGAIESDALRADKIQLDLGGSGSINLKGIEAQAVSLSVGGSGNLKSAGGTTGSLSVSIGGSGDVDFGKVKARDASVSVAGSGEATVWASTDLSVTIAGSGDVNYYGDPKVSRSVVGSGDIKRVGTAPR